MTQTQIHPCINFQNFLPVSTVSKETINDICGGMLLRFSFSLESSKTQGKKDASLIKNTVMHRR